MSLKSKFTIGALILVLFIGIFIFFRYLLTYEQRNFLKRSVDTFTGQNMTVTIFGYDGKIVKRWTNIQKISSTKDLRDYVFFYTKDNKYVQIPNSVWYIAEEE